MSHTHQHTRRSLATRILSGALTFLVPASAWSASSWSPTLLVNTEAFQTIDVGDGATNIELRFGPSFDAKIIYDLSNARFKFTKPIFVQGSITATGSITTSRTLSGQTLRVGAGGADVQGNLNASGSIRTDGNLTINDDAGATDATLTFGNATLNQTLRYNNAAQKFQFSKDVSVGGNISGSTLTIDGNVNLKGLNYNFPTARGADGTVLTEDGSGNLTWEAAASVGNGSGNSLSMHPTFPNATYFASGATTVGQLVTAYDTTNFQNYYHWTSTQGALNDYWISVRVKVPSNFSSWDPVKPIELRYRNTTASTADNSFRVAMLDTAGSRVTLTNGAGLASTSWATTNITGPQAAGTFTPGQYFTLLIKMAAKSTGSTDIGYLNFNWETTTP